MLGEFEYLVLSAAARLGESAYGTTIRKELENGAGRACSIGALYTTLDRLEHKGMVKTWMGEATAQRGGRAKRLVCLTAEGIEAAQHFYTTIMHMSRGASWVACGDTI
jgi:DNA-binding PadR family transcriptional regulator